MSMIYTVAISVCIPAYKKAARLALLLDSLQKQDFTDFEVIVSDDSPDDAVRLVCEQYKQSLELRYVHNQPALGSPENWNNAIRNARGKWIKIMHDDDAFSSPQSLRKLYELTDNGADFVFSGYHITEGQKVISTQGISKAWVKQLHANPKLLFVKNVIGHPSVILHRNRPELLYDNRMKWMVDIDFYIRCLQTGSFNYTTEPLINIGRHEAQITHSAFTDKKIVIPENLLLLHKLGATLMNNLKVYDYMWRLMRNYQVKDQNELQSLSPVPVLPALIKLLKFQRMFPEGLIQQGAVSKALMFLSWLFSR